MEEEFYNGVEGTSNHACVYWQCNKENPYDKWGTLHVVTWSQGDVCGCKRRKFIRYVNEHSERYGMYYELADDPIAFNEEKKTMTVNRTVFAFKLYSPRVLPVVDLCEECWLFVKLTKEDHTCDSPPPTVLV